MVSAMLGKMPPEVAAQLKARGWIQGRAQGRPLDDSIGTVEFLPGV